MEGSATIVSNAVAATAIVEEDAPYGREPHPNRDSKERAGAARSAAKDSPVLK